jgi:cobalt-factor III methyltransferase
MIQPATGRFWAVGVGPGDPELLTLKALRVVQSAAVVCHAGPEPPRGRALDIIRPHLRPEQECRSVLTEAMSVVSASEWRPHYRPAVEQIAAECRRGRDVALVTEGDPTLYSTAACVWQLLAELHPDIAIEIVPGVSSITAAAARVGWCLARRDEPFAVVPANYHAENLRSLMDGFPTVCLLKPGSVLPHLQQTLGDREAVYVEELGTPREWITRDLATAAGRRNYFSLVLVREVRSASKGAGRIDVVGLGPGDPQLLTQRAMDTLRAADAIVGYAGYLKPLAALGLRAELHGSPIGAETDRARHALELAGADRRVALVSSGDAGVYGMASLLLETAEQGPQMEIEVVPGVTAAVAAGALLGAPLGHDFACISLSDLLTPWETIEARLEAAARADFVLALYNPLSERRTWQLPRACEILLRQRAPQTPVGLVDRAYRPGQRVWQTTLAELTTEGVGMETTLIIGSSRTRLVQGRLVTPRGYSSQVCRERERPEELVTVPSIKAREAMNPAGRHILEESFARIEYELGPQTLPSWAFAVLRRMIHASADFDYVQSLRYSADFEAAAGKALHDRLSIVTDTEMVLHGIRTALSRTPEMTLACHLNHPAATSLAEASDLTRSAAGIRIAARHHASPLLVIGNAPTALEEALRLVAEETWCPAAIIGMPVGFVGVEEAKVRLLAQAKVPYLTCTGRKGGSAVAAAAVNALVELAWPT